MYDVGKAIRIVRLAKGLRLNLVAKSAKVSAAFLSLVESSERQPSLEVLRRVADALNVPPEALVILSMSPSETLHSTDEATERLADAVREMIAAEDAFRRRLEGDSKSRAGRKIHTR